MVTQTGDRAIRFRYGPRRYGVVHAVLQDVGGDGCVTRCGRFRRQQGGADGGYIDVAPGTGITCVQCVYLLREVQDG